MESIKRFFGVLKAMFLTAVGGFYLLTLYVFTIWLVVGSLSALQVRDQLESNRVQFTSESVQRAEESLISQERIILRTLRDSDKIGRLEERMITIALEIDQALKTYEANQAGETGAVAAAPEQSETYWFDMAWAEEFLRSPSYLGHVDWCRSYAEHPDTDPYWTESCKRVDEIDQIAAQISELITSGEAEKFAAREAEASKRIEDLYATPQARFIDAYYFFQLFPLYVNFLHEPREILVLQLTMVMGMLGSVITMTWSFVKQDKGLSFRHFLVLPAVGSMSAFVILVFLKAGQLTLTAGEATDSLSPFFLSFIGIISGLLSERAYARISQVGNNFFSVDEDVIRWGINLTDAVAEAGLSHADIATHLRVSRNEADDIIAGQEGVGVAQQRLIAACVRRDPRLLFTDQPPRRVGPKKVADPEPLPAEVEPEPGP